MWVINHKEIKLVQFFVNNTECLILVMTVQNVNGVL